MDLEQALCGDKLRNELLSYPTVNPFSVAELFRLLDGEVSSEADLADIDRLCFSVVSDLCQSKLLIDMQSDDKRVVWYDYLGLQVYLFLQGKGKYTDKSAATGIISVAIMTELADHVCTYCKITSDLLPLIVGLLLSVAGKITADAWCDYFYQTKIATNHLLEERLTQEIE
ncbi:hypothetical protein CE91St41_12270 [Oscillospiraceae bacterium]|nr:hypothetical protein CE91St40_25270 [Oscillospiraceae bacterium]BDF74338.1 hypothetical protein CE91St41_12270 [Oscillospiraceae bacterium]